MGKKAKLTPKEEIGVLKGAVVFLLSSANFHSLIDDIQYKHWTGQLRSVGAIKYVLEEDEAQIFNQTLKEK